LIAATDAKDGFTGFTGAEIKKVITVVRETILTIRLGNLPCHLPPTKPLP